MQQALSPTPAAASRKPNFCSVCLFLSFPYALLIAPTCDTVSTDHITDNARDPQRGLSRATYLLKVSRRAAQPNEEES